MGLRHLLWLGYGVWNGIQHSDVSLQVSQQKLLIVTATDSDPKVSFTQGFPLALIVMETGSLFC